MALIHFLVLILCITCCKVKARREIMDQENTYFDCVDIYEQPALQHPLLKNHKIQFYPTFAKNKMQNRSSYGKSIDQCPAGKVPIYNRTTKHQIITNSSSKFQIDDFQQYHTVALDTTQNMIFYGASADIATYNLSLQPNQYSMSYIWIESGPEMELNAIKVGSGVHPSLYGDSQLRLTGRWTIDGFRKTGCYNNICPGFVQVDPDKNHALGSVMSASNSIGSTRKLIAEIKIKQDRSTRHWWLIIQDPPVYAGYWPNELFTHLKNGASLVRFGGETYTPSNKDSPPMGSGRLPKENFKNSGFMAILQIIDSNYNEIDISEDDVKVYKDSNSNCYDLRYNGFQGEPFRQAFLYGGPGGQNCGV